MFTDYLYVLAFMGGGIFLVASAITLARFFRPSNPKGWKSSTYECGEVPVGGAWVQFNVRYYIYALLFVIFDVEAVLLVPWAVSLKSLEPRLMVSSFVLGVIFIIVLFIALAYAWRKGVLKWQ
jgi:NADH:ubiquinone oxidoreductase subunit 3 (subunit A)